MAGVISATVSQAQIARVRKRFDQNRGQPLERRLQLATLKAADLMKPGIAAAAPVFHGTLRRSVKARQAKATDGLFGKALDALVGPTAPHAHLIIEGHRIVTPGGRFVGRSTQPNPFVDRAIAVRRTAVIEAVRKEAFV